jgi:hypothetical protein
VLLEHLLPVESVVKADRTPFYLCALIGINQAINVADSVLAELIAADGDVSTTVPVNLELTPTYLAYRVNRSALSQTDNAKACPTWGDLSVTISLAN